MAESKRHHVANPIVQHGKVPAKKYAPITNELVRDKNITAEAYRVLCLMLSHVDGYEESKQGVADRYGWNSAKTGKAFANLVEQKLLIIQRPTVNDQRAYEKYHVHRAGQRFTDDQIAAFGETVVLEPQKRSRASPDVGDGVDLQEVKGPDLHQVITEDQAEHHLEHQREGGFTCLGLFSYIGPSRCEKYSEPASVKIKSVFGKFTFLCSTCSKPYKSRIEEKKVAAAT